MTDGLIHPKRSHPVDVKRCARCGEDHAQLDFVEFRGNPIVIDGNPFNWCATCPTTGDPVLLALRVVEAPPDNETKKQKRRREKNG